MIMLNIHSLTKKFGNQVVLDDLNIDIQAGERVIILGQNGAGKTTLLRCILGLYRPDSGYVQIKGKNPILDRKSALQGVAFIPQLPPPLPFSVSALLDYSVHTNGLDRQKILHYGELFELDIKEHLNKPFSKLSGGMKQKVLASIAFAKGTSFMLFDEPTANLDPDGRKTFGEIIRSTEFADSTMIFISHRIDELNTVLNRAILLDFGKVVKDEKLG